MHRDSQVVRCFRGACRPCASPAQRMKCKALLPALMQIEGGLQNLTASHPPTLGHDLAEMVLEAWQLPKQGKCFCELGCVRVSISHVRAFRRTAAIAIYAQKDCDGVPGCKVGLPESCLSKRRVESKKESKGGPPDIKKSMLLRSFHS